MRKFGRGARKLFRRPPPPPLTNSFAEALSKGVMDRGRDLARPSGQSQEGRRKRSAKRNRGRDVEWEEFEFRRREEIRREEDLREKLRRDFEWKQGEDSRGGAGRKGEYDFGRGREMGYEGVDLRKPTETEMGTGRPSGRTLPCAEMEANNSVRVRMVHLRESNATSVGRKAIFRHLAPIL